MVQHLQIASCTAIEIKLEQVGTCNDMLVLSQVPNWKIEIAPCTATEYLFIITFLKRYIPDLLDFQSFSMTTNIFNFYVKLMS